LDRWHQWAATHRDALLSALCREAQTAGFANGAMADFETLLTSDFQPLDIADFQPLTTTVFAANLSCDSLHHDYSVVETLTLGDQADDTLLTKELDHSYVFDISKVNSALATGLSDNFNYIGWACGCIVFFFLWFSFRSLKLAMLSFLPMAISWVWILGLMGLLDIRFNIVNVILATFIFGQGDDYTIFMTEGAVYEQKYGRQMLASYKHSIILSALIMFIGIGSLILARHPALHSLAEVTIVGMFSVVLMAFIFPPFILKMLKMKS
jgi:predicted RND superfamily exporter protein